MHPVVAEIICVGEPRVVFQPQVAQPDGRRVFVLRKLRWRFEAALADLEAVQVIVQPPERHLNDAVQLMKGVCVWHAYAAPDRRLDARQCDSKLQQPRFWLTAAARGGRGTMLR
jgi:hypothetical protein